jgi:hypothetical protein
VAPNENAGSEPKTGIGIPTGCVISSPSKESCFSSKNLLDWHGACSFHCGDARGFVADNTRGWIVASQRKPKRLSDVLQREYRAAVSILESDFAGEERDYCCAVGDFKRQSPLEYDLLGAPHANRYRPMNGSRFPLVGGVQASSTLATG